jgi:hypothetical protein
VKPERRVDRLEARVEGQLGEATVVEKEGVAAVQPVRDPAAIEVGVVVPHDVRVHFADADAAERLGARPESGVDEPLVDRRAAIVAEIIDEALADRHEAALAVEETALVVE